jgi:hypothetical protein
VTSPPHETLKKHNGLAQRVLHDLPEGNAAWPHLHMRHSRSAMATHNEFCMISSKALRCGHTSVGNVHSSFVPCLGPAVGLRGLTARLALNLAADKSHWTICPALRRCQRLLLNGPCTGACVQGGCSVMRCGILNLASSGKESTATRPVGLLGEERYLLRSILWMAVAPLGITLTLRK